MELTLSIVGAGKVGRVLGRQFHQHKIFTLQEVLNRSLDSSRDACDFIGAGQPISTLSKLRQADVYMITVPDDQISDVGIQLVENGLIQPSTVVFHCSGALTGAALRSKSSLINHSASVHPLRSFADPTQVANSFSGTICTIEGDVFSTKELTHRLKQCGAQVVTIGSENKTLYHAAAVFASNYLVTLVDAAIMTFKAAGISPVMAKQMAAPLAQETLNNVFRLGSQKALTGPIARGDKHTVKQHEDALKKWDQEMAALYIELAKSTTTMKDRSLDEPHDPGNA